MGVLHMQMFGSLSIGGSFQQSSGGTAIPMNSAATKNKHRRRRHHLRSPSYPVYQAPSKNTSHRRVSSYASEGRPPMHPGGTTRQNLAGTTTLCNKEYLKEYVNEMYPSELLPGEANRDARTNVADKSSTESQHCTFLNDVARSLHQCDDGFAANSSPRDGYLNEKYPGEADASILYQRSKVLKHDRALAALPGGDKKREAPLRNKEVAPSFEVLGQLNNCSSMSSFDIDQRDDDENDDTDSAPTNSLMSKIHEILHTFYNL